MKVTFRQSGGYAGLSRGCELDSATMSRTEAAKLERLVEKSRGAAAGTTSKPGARDLTSYRVTVETDKGSHQLEFDDLTVPAEATDLLAYLQRCAKPITPA